jgi:hypothetical protein
MSVKRLLLFAALVALGSLPACQCSDKPPVSPSEDDEQSRRVVVPPAAHRA